MDTPEFKDKFIGFADILGFKQMIGDAEAGRGRSLGEIMDLTKELGRVKELEFYRTHGSRICPAAPRIDKGLDFEMAQVSDCVIVSAEISPAGVMNLVNHLWGAVIMLLTKGVLVRGYITRGKIHHKGQVFHGSGYHTALEREGGVTAFRREVDEKGTPFVEVDPAVVEYVKSQPDDCVRKMFARLTKTESSTTALFPFQRLAHSFLIAGSGVPAFDPNKERKNNDNVRQGILRLKNQIMQYVDPANEKAMKKVRHYLASLEEQLKVCDRTDKNIDDLTRSGFGPRN